MVCKSCQAKETYQLGEVKSFLDAGGLESVGGTRVAILADSQVSLGVIVKGHGASPAVNRLLKGSLGLSQGDLLKTLWTTRHVGM